MEDCSMDLFSERLKELRKLSKMTQKEVGERIGMTAQGYAAFERGREPGFEKLKQLSELFAVSSDYLIGLSDSWNPSDQSTLSDYGFSDKTLEDLRRLKEKKDSFTTTPPYFQVVKEKTQDDRYLSDILNDISIESENGLAEILTYVKYMADLWELVDKKDSAFEENAKINDLFSDNSATVILSQAYRNFLTALLDSICLKMSVMREEEKDGQKLGRINRVNAEES